MAIARDFLSTEAHGHEVLLLMHPLASYRGHELRRFEALPERQEFRLEYLFNWNDHDHTWIAFYCDLIGRVNHIEVLQTTAIIPPFALGDFALQALLNAAGDELLKRLKVRLNRVEQALLDTAVKQADVKTILELQFKAEQR